MDKVDIIVDSREQEPYEFDSEIFYAKHKALDAGDYSIDGLENQISIERKSLPDFIQSVIQHRERFFKEVKKLREFQYSCIVVEGDLSDIMGKRYRSGAHPNSILGATLSLIVDHRVPVFFCSDRQIARIFVEKYLLRVFRKLNNGEKEENIK